MRTILLVTLVYASPAMAQSLKCRAIDAFDQQGKQPVQGQLNLKDDSPISWKIRELQAGEASVELSYICGNAGGSRVVVEMGAQKLETSIENSGKDKKSGRPKTKKVTLGPLKIDKGNAVLVVKQTDSPVPVKIDNVTLRGAAVATAEIEGYSLPQPTRTALAVEDLGIANNTLTRQEKKNGWKLLFNGKDLTGWMGYRKEEVPPAWKVAEGTLFLDKAAKQAGGDLISVTRLSDFELTLDWKISPKGNSGIILRAHEDKRAPYETAIEMQVHDPANAPNPLTAPGSAYALFGPAKSPSKPAGEWNHARIRVTGNHYQLWLNGIQTADFTVGSDVWNEAVGKSKWRDYPRFGRNKQGFLDLQDHGKSVWFRNIKVRYL